MLYRNFDIVAVKVSEPKPYVFNSVAKVNDLFGYSK